MIFNFIRKSKVSKVLASYLAIVLVVEFTQPMYLYALSSGPSQPEFNSFTPLETADMVDLSSGDFNYNIPIMDIGGYPINLSYNSGIQMDQQASWVGLGWNLNTGQITRQVRGLPDDFDGDLMTYKNNLKDNISFGISGDARAAVFGYDAISLGVGVGIQLNNYHGITHNTSFGPSFDLGNRVSVGMQFGSTSDGGVSVSPSISLSQAGKETEDSFFKDLSGNIGISYDNQQGLSSFNISASKSNIYSGEKFSGIDAGMSKSFKLNNYLTYTPSNPLSFRNTNITLSTALGGEVFGAEGQAQFTAWASIQQLSSAEENKEVPAYGYENTEHNKGNRGVLDFNREKDRTLNENTKALAPVNYTYDTYVLSGQGLQGSFRPYRSQVGNVYDPTVSSSGDGVSLGGEFGPGAYAHFGGDIEVNPSSSITGRWQDADNTVLDKLSIEDADKNTIDYEPIYYKMSGDLSADDEYGTSTHQYYGDQALKIGLGGGEYTRKTLRNYQVKSYDATSKPSYTSSSIQTIKRAERERRKQSIVKVTNQEAEGYGLIQHRQESEVKAHHTAGYHITRTDGSRYVYGETAYNFKKEEVSFAVGGGGSANCAEGLVSYSSSDNSVNNKKGRDHFFKNVTTPAYAHSYLLTAVLSADYEDLTNNGPTEDDLGNYTKFSYQKINDYPWRTPSQYRKASYSAGLNTDDFDDKGSYVYGEKELKYVKEIRTKTHVAIFDLSDREDARGVVGDNGGISGARMQKLDSIRLYSLPEYQAYGLAATPIKTAHFRYSYKLCPNTPNSTAPAEEGATQGGGKLSLERLWFTYKNSKMGAYTPYVFTYSDFNPSYNLKGYDVWGNYKENVGGASCDVTSGALTSTEFPFVAQEKALADENTTAWSLTSIDLPSGGKMNITQESDDYRFVQNRKAMQMFKLTGAGNSTSPSSSELTGRKLYEGNDFKKYLYVKLPDHLPVGYDTSNYITDLLHNEIGSTGDIGTQSNMLYFRVLTNMTKNGSQDYDYVTGYVSLDGNAAHFTNNGQDYLALPLQFQEKEGGLINSGEQVNPIAKAGWYFARKYLNRQAYGLSDSGGNLNVNNFNLVNSAKGLFKSLASVVTILGGPNQALKSKGIASKFIPEKSWVRLYEPFGRKYGGGSRVKKISITDQWDVMVEHAGSSLYANTYGQEYTYTDEQGKSTGVATFEPNGSKENPFVLPIFDDPVKLIAPMNSNYVEKPLGESFYPAAEVTYSKVKVKNIEKNITTMHATGEVITEFYTSKDFPVIADFTMPSTAFDPSGILGGILKLKTKNHIAMTQGFMVHTNDMNGKMKKQRVQKEGQEEGQFISGVDYNYLLDAQGGLNQEVPVINSAGELKTAPLGLTYDMVNDFRKSKSSVSVYGADMNLGVIPAFFIPLTIPGIFPNYKDHENVMKTATTTKVVHSKGILKEKVVYDLGSRISTRNLAWDEETGAVLLTEVDNEHTDRYYNFNYPANWYYEQMGLASKNEGLEGLIASVSGTTHRIYHPITGSFVNASQYLNLGDELLIDNSLYRVVYLNVYSVKLMDNSGHWAELGSQNNGRYFKIVRSGNQNKSAAQMASATTRELPILTTGSGDFTQLISNGEWAGKKVVQASAVEYTDVWNGLCEPSFPYVGSITYDNEGNIINVEEEKAYNPYLLNEKGEYRAQKSYAYLTGRNNGEEQYHPRNEGFFNEYYPFYLLSSQGNWSKEDDNWTYASEVTKFTPYGAEVENRDALGRYSSAIYDYFDNLPTAVASNAEYREVGVDHFEYFGSSTAANQVHFSFADAIDQNPQAVINPVEGHTGNRSVKISGGNRLTYTLISKCPVEEVCAAINLPSSLCSHNVSSLLDLELIGDYSFGNCDILEINVINGEATIEGFNSPLDPTNSQALDDVKISGSIFSLQICNEMECVTVNFAECH